MVPYPVRVALQSLRHERWVNILSMLTLAMALLVMTVILLLMYNVDLFTRKLPERFSVIAYLRDGLTDPETQQVLGTVRGRGGVDRVKYISKADALRELKGSVRDADYILEGMSDNPLPASIEIRLRRDAVGPEPVKALAAELRKVSGIEDVQYGEKLLLSIHTIKLGVNAIGAVLSVVLAAGVAFICYSTVKILFYRRREEIETLKLLGATRAFIRLPFLVEGGVIGATGGSAALLILVTFYYGVFMKLLITAPVFNAVVFPPALMLLLPVAGLFLGVTGAFIAVGRIRY